MQRMILFIGIVLMALAFVGCGDKKPLTSEENSLIAEYAAHSVLQNNPDYDRRLMFAESADASFNAVSADASDNAEATTEGTSEEPTTEAPKASENAKESSDNGSGTGDGDGGNGRSSSSSTLPSAGNKDLSDVYKRMGLSVTYKGYSFAKSYGDNNSSSADITPINGGQLMVVKLKLTNNGKDTAKINMLDYNYRYSVTLSTGTTYSLLTVLEDDITVFQGNIKAGKSRNVVALFEVPQGITKPLDGATFNVSNGQSEVTVALQ